MTNSVWRLLNIISLKHKKKILFDELTLQYQQVSMIESKSWLLEFETSLGTFCSNDHPIWQNQIETLLAKHISRRSFFNRLYLRTKGIPGYEMNVCSSQPQLETACFQIYVQSLWSENLKLIAWQWLFWNFIFGT